MSNSTTEYWDVDGVSLNTDVMNLTSWGGSREAPADLRGSNKVIPYRVGEIWTPKLPDARSVELSGWLVGPTVAQARTKWRALRALLWRPHEQFLLTRRWKDAAGALQTATGLAEYVSGLEPDVEAGGSRMKFKVKLKMTDPFFYGAEITKALPVGSTTAFTMPGDYPTAKMTLVIPASLTALKIRVQNASSVDDNTFTYASTAAGAVATVNMEQWTATELLAGNTTRTSGKVGHTGRPEWLYLPPTMTKFVVSATAGTGSVSLKYRTAFH